jgi:catechol 2,3-dioxygenase-like lactoylglutathione lyase family enzyme
MVFMAVHHVEDLMQMRRNCEILIARDRPASAMSWAMTQFISAVTLVVPDYDEALAFYVGRLGFDLIADEPLSPAKRWVLVAPPGSRETRLLLARADQPSEIHAIGNQTGGRVFLFLTTNNFARDHQRMVEQGVVFLESPRQEPYDTVAVFRDPFGNRWDLIEPRSPPPG